MFTLKSIATIRNALAAAMLIAVLATLVVVGPTSSSASAAANPADSCKKMTVNGPALKGSDKNCHYVVMNSNWAKVCEGSGPRVCYPGPGKYYVDIYAKSDWSKPAKQTVKVTKYRF